MDYKNTLNLPKTGFPMKADLVAREPQRLAQWQTGRLYQKIQARRAQAPLFVLHDGPPFANGDVHIGTAGNKIRKDFIIKYRSLRGNRAPYVPGWDCHGLPIEFKVVQEMRKKEEAKDQVDASAIRKACEAYAGKFIDIQRTQFQRLGILGEWDHPYLTFSPQYEADELQLFADLVEKGFIYRGKKPVYWSIPCRTALAEAEVEYQDHVSPSIYVKFPVVGHANTFVLIWTTTPWTLPANLAIAYNSAFSYTVVHVNDESYIVSVTLLSQIAEKCGWDGYQIMRSLDADHLSQIECRHPFADRTAKLLPGDAFVDNVTGTGFVHIAPGHGLEDYQLGRQHGLPIFSPVDDQGCLCHTQDLPLSQQISSDLVGKSILEKHGRSEANEAVIETLRQAGMLAHQEDYTHSYPHCWRSKTPVIFRAMDQWFIKIDHQQFREQALAAIDRVRWIPDWGKNRIEAAVKSRPDWCISRQRTWGVPIPAFYDAQGQPILEVRIVRAAAALIEKLGSNVWFEKSAAELWQLLRPADWPGPEPAAKSTDTLDVWIDSGSSSRTVTMRRPEYGLPPNGTPRHSCQADLYLEGSDQHRGWFQSSLLLSLAGNGVEPYREVLTHGFMVDLEREKISKSKQSQGGYQKPQTSDTYVKQFGADVVRLWIASQDFRSDIIVSEERLNKVGETYRGIRNALRYQLSNLYDFDPAQHPVPPSQMTGLDRWILDLFARLEAQVTAAYDAYEFHVVYQKVSQFIAVELSSIYHDVVKDRLYTDAAPSLRRRSTQTALYRMVTGLCQMLAPLLAFTTDEAWEFIPGTPVESVHLADWTNFGFRCPEAESAGWQELVNLREQALVELEKARQAKVIGKALEAKLKLSGKPEALMTAQAHAENLRELLNVSQLEFALADTAELFFTAEKADGKKCDRCWHWETSVGSHPEHHNLCGRCVQAIAGS